VDGVNDILKPVISETSTRRIAVVGLGNEDRADDGFGLHLARRLKDQWPGPVFSEEKRSAEGIVFDIHEREDIDVILFVDAMDFGGKPGDVKLFDVEDAKRFVPTFSTHKVPITLLMGTLVQYGKKPFVMGFQPARLDLFQSMSSVAQTALDGVEESLLRALNLGLD
jgi:hydrogenase 3 maturation protease